MSISPEDAAVIDTRAEAAAIRIYKQMRAEEQSMTEEQPRGESEIEEELQSAKAWTTNLKAVTDLFIATMVRSFSEYQNESLESARRNRGHVDESTIAARKHAEDVNNVALQALQNAVKAADLATTNALVDINATAAQRIRHADLAIDGQWNPVQQGAADTMTVRAVSLDDASLKAISAALATAVADALTKKTT
ncbi:MAG TPA: hypothetical protein VJ598_05935 [Albitalea sp.]|nr:hypothetical protein [Albitalea sp.]